MVNFAHYFLETEGCDGSSDELQVMQMLTRLVYECVTQDKLGILPIWITLLKVKYFYIFAHSVKMCVKGGGYVCPSDCFFN